MDYYNDQNKEYKSIEQPEHSDWRCYMFGNRPGGGGLIYCPAKNHVPNFFVRAMMRLCFDCLTIDIIICAVLAGAAALLLWPQL